jgi:hypothetical protein
MHDKVLEDLKFEWLLKAIRTMVGTGTKQHLHHLHQEGLFMKTGIGTLGAMTGA